MFGRLIPRDWLTRLSRANLLNPSTYVLLIHAHLAPLRMASMGSPSIEMSIIRSSLIWVLQSATLSGSCSESLVKTPVGFLRRSLD